MNKIQATIIILDYRKAHQVVRNVRSLLKQKADFDYKIIVIDNSCDAQNTAVLEPLAKSTKVTLRVNAKNLGYTKAHNSIKNEIEGDYVFIVNPDIEWIDEQSISKMVCYMDADPTIGVLGPKQLNKDGSTAMSIRAFPKLYLQIARRTFLRDLPFFRDRVYFDEMRHLDYGKVQEVDWLQSSCVAVRKKLWEEIGGLNERYFLFMSDVELCFEAWSRGYGVVFYPEARVEADGMRVSAGGIRHFFRSWVLRQHLKDSVRYRIRHLFDGNPRFKYDNKTGKESKGPG